MTNIKKAWKRIRESYIFSPGTIPSWGIVIENIFLYNKYIKRKEETDK